MGVSVKLNRPVSGPSPTELPARETEAPFSKPLPEPMFAKDPPALVINYPRSGKRVLPVGTTVIYIKQKKVRLPDGTIEEMYATRSVESCRCFALYTDHMIDIRISRGGSLQLTSSVFPAWLRKLDMIEFDTIEVECTEPTTFYITMSEDPAGVPQHQPETRLSPYTALGYNATDDLVEIQKVINGIMHTRKISNPDVDDVVVVRWTEYGAWSVVA
jgi:hypothetical protein